MDKIQGIGPRIRGLDQETREERKEVKEPVSINKYKQDKKEVFQWISNVLQELRKTGSYQLNDYGRQLLQAIDFAQFKSSGIADPSELLNSNQKKVVTADGFAVSVINEAAVHVFVLCGKSIEARLVQTWNEAIARSHNHPIRIDKICKRAQNRLAQLEYGDNDTLYQLRIAGKGERRLWGFKHQNILQILWWDPDHTVYPTRR